MRFLDAMLCISLSAEIHGTNREIRETAKRCLPGLKKSDRILINRFVKSSSPLESVRAFVKTIPDEILTMAPGDKLPSILSK